MTEYGWPIKACVVEAFHPVSRAAYRQNEARFRQKVDERPHVLHLRHEAATEADLVHLRKNHCVLGVRLLGHCDLQGTIAPPRITTARLNEILFEIH